MKKAIAIGVGGIFAVLFYWWAIRHPRMRGSDSHLSISSPWRKPTGRTRRISTVSSRKAPGLFAGRLGIKEQVTTGMEVAKLGYGSDKATAFNRCIVDAMYPDPERERKSRR
jgi:hypothetical protein